MRFVREGVKKKIRCALRGGDACQEFEKCAPPTLEKRAGVSSAALP